ncbi:MAG TPA: hypothetical protein VN192_05830 [Flavobacterium sp.]|nr:hypothetical protein [Flavobacterium sp.]
MEKNKITLKDKLLNEVNEYLVNFIYMALVFSAIILYRRLVLSSYGIELNDYFLGVFKALIIAKVVMITNHLKIIHYFENKSLIISALYKSIVFTILVMIFEVIEGFISNLIHSKELMNAATETWSEITIVWVGGCMLIFIIFIPFFAFRELVRILGKEKISDIIIRSQKKE